MTSKFLIKTLATSAVIFSVAAVSAQDAEIPRVQRPDSRAGVKVELLKRYDKDKDGKLGKEEIENIARDRMLANDRNKDGRVDQVELKAMRARTHQMPKMDALQRAMARERAIAAAKLQEKERLEKAGATPESSGP